MGQLQATLKRHLARVFLGPFFVRPDAQTNPEACFA